MITLTEAKLISKVSVLQSLRKIVENAQQLIIEGNFNFFEALILAIEMEQAVAREKVKEFHLANAREGNR